MNQKTLSIKLRDKEFAPINTHNNNKENILSGANLLQKLVYAAGSSTSRNAMAHVS